MQFVHPELLWGLLALSIPIIVHLFHFRRFKKVYFTNVRFLKEIKEEKSARRQLRNLLILLCRMLALAFIVLAFAQPYFSANDTAKTGRNNVSIFIDNSFSMMASSADIPLLDQAKRKAEELVSAYGPSDQFQIFSHELKASQQRWINKDNTRSAIDEIDLSPEVSKMNTVLNRIQSSKASDGNHIVYILSDFQKSISDISVEIDTSLEINFIPLQAVKENNISIDSAWFESVVPAPNQNNTLYVRMYNHGDQDAEDIRVSLVHNGQRRPEGTINIPSNSSKIDTINLLVSETGWQEVELRIEDYPIQFDDTYYLSFNIKDRINVLSIQEGNQDRFIEAVFRGLNNFELTTVRSSSIQYDQFRNYDLILMVDLPDVSTGLSSEIESYIRQGGNVLLFPSRNASLSNYNILLQNLEANNIERWQDDRSEVYKINTSEFVFENVFDDISNNLKLPVTSGYYVFENSGRKGGETLLSYRNGDFFVNKYKRNKGNLFVSAAPLDQSYNDLVTNAEIFVPLLYKAAYASSQNEKKAYTIGVDNTVEVQSNSFADDVIFRIQSEEEFIPGQNSLGDRTILSFNNMVKNSGYYDVMLEDNKVTGLAFNFDRLESKMDYMNSEELKSIFEEKINIIDTSLNSDLGIMVKEKDKGIILWSWCLIFTLLFLAIETALLRFWKI